MNGFRRLLFATAIAACGLLVPVAGAQAEEDQDADKAFGGGRYGAAPMGEEAAPAQTGDTDVDTDVDVDTETRDVDLKPRTEMRTEEEAPPMAEPVVIREERRERSRLLPFGMGIAVGGGVADYIDGNTESATDPQGTWDARLILGTHSPIGLEAAYIGSAGNIDALGLDNDALLVSNGVEGLVRVNLGRMAVQPFVFGGAAWQRFNLANEGRNTSSIAGEDDVLALPVGGGISAYVGNAGLMLDARFTYRPTFREDMLPAVNESQEDLDSWNVSARIGYEF